MAGLLDGLSPEAFARLDALLDQALDATPDARAALVAGLAPPERQALERLLAGAEGEGAVDRVAEVTRPARPEIIGTWRLGELLGEGMSSVVFAATPLDDALEIPAALKLMRGGYGSEPFVERFHRERRILIGLRHPHIVRVLDGGRTESGQPWYAMERVDGEPLTRWCAGRPLSARIRALISVCDAVAYAHQRLIVHCDLKPENLIVDREGAPRVLDFGIAKLLDAPDLTQTGMRMLTPRWAAPEQVLGEPVSTATDVYALGLLLWAVITGAVPREGITGNALLADVQRPIAPPSAQAPAAAGDLDAVVARATAVDPAERYPGASALADDLRRVLAGAPVLARTASPVRLAVVWARRHRVALAVLAGFVALLAVWGGSAAQQARRLAVERDRAHHQAGRAEAALDLLVSMLEAGTPANARGEVITAQEVLQASVRELGLGGRDPALDGEIWASIGRVQTAIGTGEEAVDSLTRAVDQLTQTHGPTDPHTLRAQLYLARAEFAVDPEGPGLERAEAALAQLRGMGAPKELAEALLLVGELWGDRQQMARALVHVREARLRFAQAGASRLAARALAVEGYALAHLRDPSGHRVLADALDATIAVLGTDMHPDVADILHELALVYPGDKVPLVERSIALRRRLYGDTSISVANSMNNLGLALETTDPERSIALLEEAWRIAQQVSSPDDFQALRLGVNYGAVLSSQGRPEPARAVLTELLGSPGMTEELAVRAQRWLPPDP